MYPSILRISLIVVIAAVSSVAFALDQPRMRESIDLLREAKNAKHPVPILEAARKQLHEAAHNKKGWRVKSLAVLDEAIAEAKVGNHEKMVQKIDHVLADVWNGIDAGRK